MATKVDIFSGFLGAGKTTLIKKLIKEAYAGEKLVLIENEFGQVGIDGGFLKDAGIEITEMNSGCICCSLVGDFSKALKEVLDRFTPDRILIEPSGVGKLSDVAEAVENVDADIQINGLTTVVDASKCKMYMSNFGEFFENQIESAKTVILSHTSKCSEAKINDCIAMVKAHNPNVTLVTTDWDRLTGKQLLDAIVEGNSLAHDLQEMAHAHHHDHDDHDENEHEHHHHGHEHEHHHDHDEHCECEHEHEHEHHHEHDEHCGCEHEHHHHEHDEHCECGHEHHHHADEVFDSIGLETARKFTTEEITDALNKLNTGKYGMVLRAKGIVDSGNDEWIHFDFVPDEPDIRTGAPDIIGRICVIGTDLHEEEIKALFA